jgi:hypothetical protein
VVTVILTCTLEVHALDDLLLRLTALEHDRGPAICALLQPSAIHTLRARPERRRRLRPHEQRSHGFFKI